MGLTGITGCVHTSKPDAPCTTSSTGMPMAALPIVNRPVLEPPLAMLVNARVDQATLVSQPAAFHGLTEPQAQSLAVANTSIANQLEHDSKIDPNAPSNARHIARRQHDEQETFRRTVMHFVAQDLRNRQAGGALEVYYRLAEAEVTGERLEESSVGLQATTAKAKESRDRGIALPIKYEDLQRQQIELDSNRVQVASTIEQLNTRLRGLLGLTGPGERLMPMELPALMTEPIDVARATQVALQYRADLQLLRYIEAEISVGNLVTVRNLLGSVNSLLGTTVTSDFKLFLLSLSETCFGQEALEVAQRRAQVQNLRHDREQQAINEVQTAIRNIETGIKRIALARDRLINTQLQEDAIQKRSSQGLSSFLEESSGQQDVLKARVELIKEMMAWQRARIELKQAQGMLVFEVSGH